MFWNKKLTKVKKQKPISKIQVLMKEPENWDSVVKWLHKNRVRTVEGTSGGWNPATITAYLSPFVSECAFDTDWFVIDPVEGLCVVKNDDIGKYEKGGE